MSRDPLSRDAGAGDPAKRWKPIEDRADTVLRKQPQGDALHRARTARPERIAHESPAQACGLPPEDVDAIRADLKNNVLSGQSRDALRKLVGGVG